MSLKWLVARRYLRSKRQEGFISIIAWFSLVGIALGVATLIVVMAVMNGFQAEFSKRIIGLSGHVSLSDSRGIDHVLALQERLARVPGVSSVLPLVEGMGLVSAHGGTSFAVFEGVRQKDISKRPLLAHGVVQGDIRTFKGRRLLLGQRLAERLRVGLGDRVTLLSPKGLATAFGFLPQARTYTVAGVFNVGMYTYDSNYVYLPLEEAQSFLRFPHQVNRMDLMLQDPSQAVALAHTLQKHEPYKVLSWEDRNRAFLTALETERNVMFAILTLIILVAAFNIISSQIMLVNDKRAGIAIMKTMGMPSRHILQIFFITGSSVGVIGTAVGVLLGLVVAENIENLRQWLQAVVGADVFNPAIYFLSHLPSQVEPLDVLAVTSLSLALSCLSSLYPAWKASRLNPVDILRYE